MSLLLHCGAHLASWEDVCDVEPNPPTSSFTPVPHSHFVQLAKDQLEELGYGIIEEAHALMAKGQRYFGFLKLRSYKDEQAWPIGTPSSDQVLFDECIEPIKVEYDYVLGLRNGNDGTLAASAAFGTQATVCDNLCFHGNMMQFARKHTRHVMSHLPHLMWDELSNVDNLVRITDARYAHYKEKKVETTAQFHDIMMTALRQKAIVQRAIEPVVDEWEKAQMGSGPGGHKELGGNSYWTLLNCFTEVDKKSPSVVQVPDRTRRLTKLLDARTQYPPAAYRGSFPV